MAESSRAWLCPCSSSPTRHAVVFLHHDGVRHADRHHPVGACAGGLLSCRCGNRGGAAAKCCRQPRAPLALSSAISSGVSPASRSTSSEWAPRDGPGPRRRQRHIRKRERCRQRARHLGMRGRHDDTGGHGLLVLDEVFRPADGCERYGLRLEPARHSAKSRVAKTSLRRAASAAPLARRLRHIGEPGVAQRGPRARWLGTRLASRDPRAPG